MNHYLAMLKQSDKKNNTHQIDTLQNLQNPDNGSFVGFEGMPSSEYKNFKTLQDIAPNQTEHSAQTDVQDRYAHLITCQQCEHLSLTGYCRVQAGYKPMPDAGRECGQFVRLSSERPVIANKPYSQSELNDLLGRYEKKLLYHLIECRDCCLQDAHYCGGGFAVGSAYDALLLCFVDAPARKEALLTQVIRSRISGRNVFGGAK